MKDVIRINEKDNVAVALTPVAAGTVIEPDPGKPVTVQEDIPQGHKVALSDIRAGENVIKYGFSIGHVLQDVAAGSWLHTHNVKTNLEGEIEYRYEPEKAETWNRDFFLESGKDLPETFRGFIRKDGRVAIRNEIWIIPTVGCVNGIVSQLASENQDLVSGSIDGIYAFTHPFGCSQTGEDHAQTRKLLAALVNHPNAASVLVVGLGCENLTHEQFLEELGDFDKDRVKFLICQDVEDEFEAGRDLLEQCAVCAGQFERKDVPVSGLVIGMKCGGSDGLSGITANPAVGAFSDLLCARGGTTVLTEVPEMFGAEGMLMNRCASSEVFDRAVRMLNGFKHYFISHHEVVYDNPSPGNKKGGITTLEDKSCGCVQKGGSAPVADVLNYADQVRVPGLNMMYGPGNDLVSSTALTAAGCHMILFTTGRGTPFGAPAPTVKIATNSALYERKHSWMDFNAGTIAAEGESIQEAAKRLFRLVIETAEGAQTWSEKKGYREISIFKDGVVL